MHLEQKVTTSSSMQLFFPPQAYEAFPFLRPGHHVDGIGRLSYQSLVGDAALSKTEAATTVHT